MEIFQNLTNKEDNNVIVHLFDEDGKTIANKAIKLKVNNVDLDFKEKQELYYMTTTEYSAGDIPAGVMYNLEIILTDGTSYSLGSIAPIAESREKDIVCDEKGDFDKDFNIYWYDLKEINELSVTKSVRLSTSTKTEQNYDYEPVVTKKIWANGKYVMSKSDYITSKSTISSLEIKFNALKFGRVNTELLEGSEIKISGHIDKIIDFDE